MTPKQHLHFLWNGGLNPETASPDDLRERRTISATIFALTPVGILVMVINLFRDLSADNPIIGAGLLFTSMALYIQAVLNSPKIAANIAVAGFWGILALVMTTSGIFGQTWIWLFAIPGIATLLSDLKSGVFWSIVCMLTVWVFSSLQLAGKLNLDEQAQILDDGYVLGLATEGTLVLAVLCVSVLIFRYSQNAAESKLKKSVITLEREIQSRIKAEETALNLEQSKSRFLAAMSHEIRTPMNGVIGAIRLLLESNTDREKDEYALIAQESGEVLLELVNSIMDLSALESGSVSLEEIAIDLPDFIDKTMAPFQYQAKSLNLDLIAEIDECTPQWIMGDPTRLRQIFVNLVGNALKFTEHGEVKLSIKLINEQLRVKVSDTGVGISKQALTSLFEPYVQAEISTNRKFGGYGLGLSIVKKLITEMGGTIEVSSELGHGSQFSISFPYQACNSTSPTTLDADTNKIAPLKVLVADDNAVNRMVLSRLLEKDKHIVVAVINGEEAVDYVKNNEVDVILMDIQMPELDGISATKIIRDFECARSSTPIIAITANTSSSEIESMLAAGMNAYLAKPFRYEDIQEILASIGEETIAAR